MEAPGALLFRDPDGYIYALELQGLKQIDLSDDYVVLMLFADGEWEDNIQPIQINDGKEKPQTLKLSDKEFKEFLGLMSQVEGEDE